MTLNVIFDVPRTNRTPVHCPNIPKNTPFFDQILGVKSAPEMSRSGHLLSLWTLGIGRPIPMLRDAGEQIKYIFSSVWCDYETFMKTNLLKQHWHSWVTFGCWASGGWDRYIDSFCDTNNQQKTPWATCLRRNTTIWQYVLKKTKIIQCALRLFYNPSDTADLILMI